MENLENKANGEVRTKEGAESVRISAKDAQEYRAYKQQKKIAEITGAISRSATPVGVKDDMKRLAERAARFRQKSIKVHLTQLTQAKNHLQKSAVKVDCIVGGNGETLTKVKVYETRIARKSGAGEITLAVTPSQLLTCQYGEIKREIRRVKRAARTAVFKVWADKHYPFPLLARMARLASETGVDFFSVPYFLGCERLRYDLFGKCRLEVSDVETLEGFKKMAWAGVERIVSSHISEVYLEWMKEVDEIPLGEKKTLEAEEKKEEDGEKPHSLVSDLKFV